MPENRLLRRHFRSCGPRRLSRRRWDVPFRRKDGLIYLASETNPHRATRNHTVNRFLYGSSQPHSRRLGRPFRRTHHSQKPLRCFQRQDLQLQRNWLARSDDGHRLRELIEETVRIEYKKSG
ncbi:hypothetical protein BUALT_Bualt03G0098000 [Buddleja alternifolia]|uniref:Uncharacterized protein n=1 Tax=Buddleja alternifolia TaxID=168488 RepID=A0AAV6Y385_9LAMI|nr:hypothetical protein BUALT_Bualt03G0098000 [Buddleja alternifolia]